MKVAFILPYQNDGLEPLGILYLSSVLKEAGNEVRGIPPTKRAISRVVSSFRPDILAYSVATGWHQQYTELNRWIKTNLLPDVLSVFGGPHPTYFPSFINEDGVDAICLGEGEQAFVEFVTRLAKQDHWTTKNWWIKSDGIITKNPLRPELQNLDELPFPDRALLDPYPSYINRNLRVFIASRGCPYNCSYCFNHAYRRLYEESGLATHVRRRSVDNIIAEIRSVRKQYGMRSVAFFDDVFVTATEWLDEFSDKYSCEIGIPFECNLRVEQVTQSSVSALKRAGCAIIAVGVETASEEVRANVVRRRHTNEQLEQACALIRGKGILLKTYNILGLPPGNIEADLQTLELNVALEVDLPTASIFQPYPGTDLGEEARRSGYWDGDVDSIQQGFYGVCQLNIRDRYKIELLQKLFLVSVTFSFLIPLARLILRFAHIRMLRRLVFKIHRYINRLGLVLGRRLFFAEDMRRLLLTRMSRRQVRPA